MIKKDGLNTLSMPFMGLLYNLGHAEYDWFHYFEQGTLFWSLTRLFGCYYRIVSIYDPYGIGRNTGDKTFLNADIENYIIRYRIILNDIAFIIRQLFPQNIRGLKGPSGGVHPKNKEMSFHDLYKYFKNNENEYPEIRRVFINNENWLFDMKDQRDLIIHYKSQAVIFGDGPDYSFAMLNAAGTEQTILTENGGEQIVTTPVFDYINRQTLLLINLLNHDLYDAIKLRIEKNRLKYNKATEDVVMRCLGIGLFKSVNKIEFDT